MYYLEEFHLLYLELLNNYILLLQVLSFFQDNYHTYYDNMRNGTHYTTSQPTPEEFIRHWTPTLEEGLDILYLGFSSALSGTVQSAYIAREDLLKRFPERKIIVVDTLCASAGQGLLIEYVIEKQNSGASLEETAAVAGIRRVILETAVDTTDSHRLYLSAGYSQTGYYGSPAGAAHCLCFVEDINDL